MKRITTILMLLMLVCMGGWAQVVTDYASAGSPVTYSTYVASAGTGAKYAFMMPSDNGATLHKWVGFNSTVGRSDNLTVDQLFVLENSSTPSKYWLKRYSNSEYLAGENSFSSTPLDLTLVNRQAGDYASEYSSSDLHISFDNDGGGHFNNGNGSYNFAGGTGGWSTCIAYGPYYVVEVNYLDAVTSDPIQAATTYIVKDGTTINAPEIERYISNGESVTVNGADAVLNCTYKNWTPNIDNDAFVTVGEKVASFTAASDKDDNAHWYILTQTRGGESPMYNVSTGSQLQRTGTNITPSTINGTSVTGNLQYLIRFIATGSDGIYKIQFANGDFITSSLTTSSSSAGNYAFYNCNGGSGSYFAWNLNSKSGSRVDNNSAGGTLSFWGSGEVSGTTGNNVWYLYETEVSIPSYYVQYQISDGSGVVYTSNEVAASLGDVFTELPNQYKRDYCSYSVTSTTVSSTGVTTVPVTVFYDLPFTVSSDFAGATWYYATLRGKYLRADDSAKDGYGRYATNATNEYTDAYKWAFFGNPYDNFYVMNKAQGSSKYMYKGDSQITFDSPAEPTADNKALWAVTPNSNGGFTLRNIDGGANWYVNDASNSGNLGFWNSSNGANDGGSNWLVTEVPTIEVDVTYELWEGGAKVNTVVERVAANSAVAVPASLTANYSTFAYNFASSGTIGEENCTITVTATLKSGVTPVGSLSNSKKYRLTTPTRGSLSTYTTGDNTYLASPAKSGLSISAKEFAILNYDSKYYLYSVSDEKFVTYQSATVAPLDDMVTGTSDAIAFSQTTNSVYQIRFDNDINKIVNCSDSDPYPYGVVLNDWGRASNEWDDGNQYIIEEVGDFDATTPLTALGNFLNSLAYANSIAELKAINWGLGGNHGKPNYYNLTGGTYVGYAGMETSIIEALEGAGYSAENLAIAQDMLANYALNMPTTGKFYRIKGYSNNYITSNTASSNAAMNGTASANNIVYYSAEQNFIFYGSGLGMYNTSIVAPVGSTLNAYTFSEGAQSSHYYIRSNAAGMGTYCYDNTANGTKVDRNTSPVTSGSYQTDWTLEEVTSLPVTISSVGYATLYAPVALTIPSSDGVKAYTGEISGDVFRLSEVDGTIPANTGVVLIGDAGTYNFNITSSAAFDGSNDLLGTVRTIAKPGDVLVLGMNGVVGFYTFTGANLSGFKTYLPEPTSGARALKIIFEDSETTGVNEVIGKMSEATDGAVYDLQGRKVANPSRGLYIINGKKVVIK